MKLAIVSDTASNFTFKEAEELGIYLLPVQVTFDGVSYLEDLEISTEEFYKKMEAAENLPTTAAPALGDFLELFSQLSDEYDQVLAIHMGHQYSSTVEVAQLAKEQLGRDNITVYDSELISVLSGALAVEAQRLNKAGASLAEIIQRLDDMKEKTLAFAILDTVENLVKGGRVSAVVGGTVKLFNIKPIARVDYKGINIEKLSRTAKRGYRNFLQAAFNYIDELDYPAQILVAHGDNPEGLAILKEDVESQYPGEEIQQVRLSSAIGVHGGSKILAIGIIPTYQ